MARGKQAREATVSKRKQIKYFDYSLLFIVIFLLGFGLVMLYSTSAYTATLKTGNSAFYLRKQAFAAALGFIGMAVCAKMDYHFFQRFSTLIYGAAIVLCTAVIFVGTSSHGQSRWLYIGPISIQPSELAKVAVIIYFAAVISRAPKKLRSFSNVVKAMLFIIPIFGVVAYNNLSTAIIIFGIAAVMVFVANPRYAPFLGILVVAAIGIIMFIMMASYRRGRIDVWLDPTSSDKGYQTLQGLYAIGSGGLFGKGLGESIQKLGFVPEAQNDMIFSIICEELGLFGAMCVILMFILLIWRFMVIAMNAKDMFGSFLVIGIMTHIALQVILNIAVVTNTIPNTGVTLPFISYGGTSIAILLSEMGIALGVSKEIQFDV